MGKRKTYSEELRLNYLNKWEASALSAPKFCKESGISFHTFKYWQKKYKLKKLMNNNPETFVPVKVLEDSKSHPSPIAESKVTYPNVIKISCPLEIDEAHLKIILNSEAYV